MKKKKRTPCRIVLKKNLIKEDVFEREIFLCQSLFKENNGGCSWAKCESCGVIPLLYKLHKGQLIDKPGQLRQLRRDTFNK